MGAAVSGSARRRIDSFAGVKRLGRRPPRRRIGLEAKAVGLIRKSARKWIEQDRAEGDAGLVDGLSLSELWAGLFRSTQGPRRADVDRQGLRPTAATQSTRSAWPCNRWSAVGSRTTDHRPGKDGWNPDRSGRPRRKLLNPLQGGGPVFAEWAIPHTDLPGLTATGGLLETPTDGGEALCSPPRWLARDLEVWDAA